MTIPLITRCDIEGLGLEDYVCRVKAALVVEPFILRTETGDIVCEAGYVIVDNMGSISCMDKRYFETQFVLASGGTGTASRSVTINPDG